MGPTLIVKFLEKKLKHSSASTGLSASFCEMFGTGHVNFKGLLLLGCER